jgi:hypothetical protein
LLSFFPAVDYPVGTSPQGLAVADFNGDGQPDVAVANIGSNDVSVLLGNRDGTFQPAVKYSTGGEGSNHLAVGDFRGIGILDLAVTNRDSNTVSILFGNGDGTFLLAGTYQVGQGPVGIEVYDLNLDGKLDLAVANFGGTTVSVLLGNGDGTFQPAVSYEVGLHPREVRAGDLNGEGIPGLVTANNGSNDVSVLLGNGDGTFQTAVNYATGAQGCVCLKLADLNGDGNLDVAVANLDGRVSVLFGAGDGSFGGPAVYAGPPPMTNCVYATTLRMLALADLATAASSENSVYVLLNNGDGTFRPDAFYAVGENPTSLIAADLNGDGFADVVASNTGSNSISVLINAADWSGPSPSGSAGPTYTRPLANPTAISGGNNQVFALVMARMDPGAVDLDLALVPPIGAARNPSNTGLPATNLLVQQLRGDLLLGNLDNGLLLDEQDQLVLRAGSVAQHLNDSPTWAVVTSWEDDLFQNL